MTRIEYRAQSKKRVGQAVGRPATDVMIPLVLLCMGFAIYGVEAFQYASGRKTAGFFLAFIGVLLGLQTVLGTVAAFVTAKIASTSFGELWTAMLKLAGIIIFTGALSLAIPYGGLLVVFIYLGLLMWLFGLEFGEAVIFSIVFTVIRFAVVLTLSGGFTQ